MPLCNGRAKTKCKWTKKFNDKMPASNGRFGASGAVARPKVCANLEVLRPSKRQWKPRLRQAALTLGASGRQRSGKEACGNLGLIYNR